MSNLKELVPPLNLCKLIPQGEFEDSCFVRIGEDVIVLRCDVRIVNGKMQSDIYPAPMFVEIIDELPVWELQEDLLYAFDRIERALKIWLKEKGIEA